MTVDTTKLESLTFDLGNGAQVELKLTHGERPEGGRHCGSCSLCCRLLPVKELHKGGNTKCSHSRQRAAGCCTLYTDHRLPAACSTWSCRWLVDPACATPRPDRAHYVIDVLPDFILAKTGPEDAGTRYPVVQIWIDPDHRDAHEDPRLRQWIADNAVQTGMAALIRYGETGGFLLVPPSLNEAGIWLEKTGNFGQGVGLWNNVNPFPP